MTTNTHRDPIGNETELTAWIEADRAYAQAIKRSIAAGQTEADSPDEQRALATYAAALQTARAVATPHQMSLAYYQYERDNGAPEKAAAASAYRILAIEQQRQQDDRAARKN